MTKKGRAFVVVDLGYGDAGKGTTVDYLVRKEKAGLVVRFNGGCQAAHNVVLPDGRHHSFSTWGSGTLAGAPTYLSEYVFVDPLSAFYEAEALIRLGIRNPYSYLYVSPDCPMILPWHLAENRIREIARGEERHGSCGIGFGAAVGDDLAGYRVRFGDIGSGKAYLRGLLRADRDRKMEELVSEFGADFDIPSGLYDLLYGSIDELVGIYSHFFGLVGISPPEAIIDYPMSIVFEGAQGVLIDQVAGTAPYRTWSDCTFENAERILKRFKRKLSVTRLGVVRTYMVRHGPGPFPTEDETLDYLPEPHNEENEWQGPMRRGYADFEKLDYAIGACDRKVDALVVTHMDHGLPGRRWRTRTGALAFAPSKEPLSAARVFEDNLGLPIRIGSFGSTFEDKTEDRVQIIGKEGRAIVRGEGA